MDPFSKHCGSIIENKEASYLLEPFFSSLEDMWSEIKGRRICEKPNRSSKLVYWPLMLDMRKWSLVHTVKQTKYKDHWKRFAVICLCYFNFILYILGIQSKNILHVAFMFIKFLTYRKVALCAGWFLLNFSSNF